VAIRHPHWTSLRGWFAVESATVLKLAEAAIPPTDPIYLTEYEYDKNIGIEDPGAGQIGTVPNDKPDEIEQIVISSTDLNTDDQNASLATISIGDNIELIQTEGGARFSSYNVGSIVDHGGWWEFGVMFIVDGGKPQDNKDQTFGIIYDDGVPAVPQSTEDLPTPGNVLKVDVRDNGWLYIAEWNADQSQLLLGVGYPPWMVVSINVGTT